MLLLASRTAFGQELESNKGQHRSVGELSDPWRGSRLTSVRPLKKSSICRWCRLFSSIHFPCFSLLTANIASKSPWLICEASDPPCKLQSQPTHCATAPLTLPYACSLSTVAMLAVSPPTTDPLRLSPSTHRLQLPACSHPTPAAVGLVGVAGSGPLPPPIPPPRPSWSLAPPSLDSWSHPPRGSTECCGACRVGLDAGPP